MRAPLSPRLSARCAGVFALSLLVSGLTLAIPGHARAQDATAQVQRMNKRAMSDYDNLEFELARKTLMDAVSLLRQAGLDESPVAAKTYLNLGVVYVAGFKDRNRGMQQFVQALKITPTLKLDPSVASPELDEVFAAARKQVGGSHETPPSNGGAVTEPEQGGGEEAKGLQHTPIDEAQPGEPITIKAQIGPEAGAAKLFVLYRSSGQADYTALQMKGAGGGDFAAVIPGEAIADRPLQYYIEARDKKGRPVLSSGSATNPYIITLSEVAPGARIVRTTEKKPENTNAFHRLFLFVQPGFGIGYHPAGNTTEVAWQLRSQNGSSTPMYQRAAVGQGGVVLSPFYIGVEAGGMVTRHFSLSLVGRFQVLTGANAQTVETESGMPPVGGTTKAPTAIAGFLRARYRFLNGKFHPYIHVDIGGGEIRHALNLSGAQTPGQPLVDEVTARTLNNDPTASIDKQLVCPDSNNCYDSLRLGFLFLGGGVGLWYDVWKYIALTLDVNVLGAIAVGGGQSGMNMDISLGIGAHFWDR